MAALFSGLLLIWLARAGDSETTSEGGEPPSILVLRMHLHPTAMHHDRILDWLVPGQAWDARCASKGFVEMAQSIEPPIFACSMPVIRSINTLDQTNIGQQQAAMWLRAIGLNATLTAIDGSHRIDVPSLGVALQPLPEGEVTRFWASGRPWAMQSALTSMGLLMARSDRFELAMVTPSVDANFLRDRPHWVFRPYQVLPGDTAFDQSETVLEVQIGEQHRWQEPPFSVSAHLSVVRAGSISCFGFTQPLTPGEGHLRVPFRPTACAQARSP